MMTNGGIPIEPNHAMNTTRYKKGSQMKEEVIFKHILTETRTTNRLIRKNNELLSQLIAELKRRNQF